MTRQPFRFTLLLLICLSIPLTATAQTVDIPDPNLRAAIEAELGKAPGDTITADEMATLAQLEARDVDIRVLTGLERATNLTRLILFNASISDLSPLAGLTNLTELDLVGGSISDLSPLAGLTQLTRLDLVDHSISDLSPLAGLTNLTFLSLVYSPISDISPLAGLTQLTTLYLYNNSISDISPLAGLTLLTLLLLNNNSISDISPLVTNTGLGLGGTVATVIVNENPLSDASINTHIPALQRRGVNVEFDAIVMQPEDMGQMGDIPDPYLRAAIEAELGKASGDTITADEMATLTQIEVENANISNLTGLERATNLTRLILDNSLISDISPLAGLTNLTRLELSSPFISDLSDISPLAGLTQLTILRLNNHSIADISPLAGLTNLTTLVLYNNSISDISPLAELTNLTRLVLNRNNIFDISPLTGLTNLTRLEFSNTFISDISPLVANTGLGNGDWVDMRENPLNDASINTHIPALVHRGVTIEFNGMILRPEDIVRTVDIPDPNLRAAIEAKLGKASGTTITTNDMETLTILLAPNANISDLAGLEYATYLRELNLGAVEAEGRFVNSNSVSDLSPLAGLRNLRLLGLDNNSISNISPLAELTLLRFLGLGGNNITDISSLAGLTRLTTLGLWENSIADLSPLAGLTRLTNLRLRTNNITDLSPLAGLTNLTWLDLGNNSISDISHLAGLTHLTTLNLNNNSISDISHLAGLTHLTTLNLNNNSIADISHLTGLTNLTLLGLDNNSIADISGLTNLTLLGLDNNSIADISPLAGLTNLRFLGLGTNNITDFSPLVDIFFLRILGLGANNITDISPVARLTQLTDLNLENNSISDLLPLARLNKLTFLDLDSNSISDISPLVANTGLGEGDIVYVSKNPLSTTSINTHIPALVSRGVTVHFGDIVVEPEIVDIPDPNLRAAIEAKLGKASGATIATNDMATLTILFAPNANISDLTGLEHATNLTKLNLGDVEEEGRFINSNSVSDISPLAGLTQLTLLGLENNSIANISPLAGLTNLTGLEIGGNKITDISSLAGLTKLTLLWLNNNSIADISPLTGLTNLKTLVLENNSIANISPLAGLTNLTQLRLYINPISDISPLAGLTKLTSLGLGRNNISDISPLAGLTNLTTLSLWINSISDLSPLVANTGLGEGDRIDVSENPLNSVSINTHIPALQSRGITVEFDDIVALPADVRGPSVTKMNVTDGEEADLEVLNRDGIIIEFDERIAYSSLKLTLEDGTNLSWESTVKDNSVTLTPIEGKELVHETSYVVRGTVRDGVGNETDLTLTFVAVKSLGTEDVNSDGIVNILDLVFVASALGDEGQGLVADVNEDGLVDIVDLVLVAREFGGEAAAPSLYPQALELVTAADVRQWLIQAQHLALTDPDYLNGIIVLEQLLAALTPKQTALLPNYPNPFNPETWMPYHLSNDANVKISIYDTRGELVRWLDLGHQIAGYYANRAKAAYWDGKNNFGEQVASGVYFYHLSAGDYSATRKMLILK